MDLFTVRPELEVENSWILSLFLEQCYSFIEKMKLKPDRNVYADVALMRLSEWCETSSWEASSSSSSSSSSAFSPPPPPRPEFKPIYSGTFLSVGHHFSAPHTNNQNIKKLPKVKRPKFDLHSSDFLEPGLVAKLWL